VEAPLDVDVSREWVPTMPRQPEQIRIVLVSECAAADDADNYGASDHAVFDATTLEAFAAAGLQCSSVSELRVRGIYLTVAIRHPKAAAGIRAATVKQFAPTLAEELALLLNVRVYLLMGDVAIAAVNHIARARTGRRVIPAGSTYRIRGGTYTLDGIRVLPSYLQAGQAWYIEASKREMIAEDICPLDVRGRRGIIRSRKSGIRFGLGD
jgi:uracil-DNA glycosylase